MSVRALTYVTLALFVLAGGLHAAAFRWKPRTARAVLPTAEIVDLGPVDQGEKVPFTFRVLNSTAEAITVVGLRPSCGCTTLDDVAGARIDPSGELRIRGEFDTNDRRGQAEVHAVLDYKRTETGPERNLILTVRAEVRPIVRAVPEPIVLDPDTTPGDPPSVTVAFDSERLDSFRVVAADTPVRWLRARVLDGDFQREASGGQVARIQVSIDTDLFPVEPGLPIEVSHWLRVQTTADTARTVLIPIHVHRSPSEEQP